MDRVSEKGLLRRTCNDDDGFSRVFRRGISGNSRTLTYWFCVFFNILLFDMLRKQALGDSTACDKVDNLPCIMGFKLKIMTI